MKQTELVEAILRDIPETRANNDLVWREICLLICEAEGINTIESFINNTILKKLPTVHSVAASISVVRKNNPELRPIARQQYIDEYLN